MTNLKQYLDSLKALEARATPGPWADYNGFQGFGLIEGIAEQGKVTVVVDDGTYDNRYQGVQRKPDAAFIAASRNALPKLIEALEEAVGALEEFRLGHEHAPGLDHTRAMGDTYGWCDHCHTKVKWGPGYAEEALANVNALIGEAK